MPGCEIDQNKGKMKWTQNTYLYYVITRLSILRLTKSDYAENIYVLNYETVHMSTFRNVLLKLQNPTLFPGYIKTTKSYSKTK